MDRSPADRERPGRRVRIGGWIFVVVSVACLAILWVRQGGEVGRLRADLAAAGWRLRPGWAVASLAPAIAALFLMAAVWVGLFRRLGGRCSAGEGIRVWMTANLGRYVPGKIWQLAGLAAYMRQRRESGAAALVAAALFQVLVLGTGAAVALAALGAALGGPRLRLPALALVAVLFALLLHPAPVGRLARAVGRRIGEVPDGIAPDRRTLWTAGATLLGAWLLEGLGLWFLWRGVGAPPQPGPWTLAGAFAGAYVAGYLALFSPGGLVVREGALAALLVAVAPVPLRLAAAFALLARVWATAAELGGLGLAWSPALRRPGARPLRADACDERRGTTGGDDDAEREA